jgi:sirohydrochlorin ferrochelatase
LVDAVAAALPCTQVASAFVDVQQPDVPKSIDAIDADRSIVLVPLLLSAGYHVHVDLAQAAAAASTGRVHLTGALGPDRRLARILAERLQDAGLRESDRVVLAAAGSSDRNAVEDCHRMVEYLEDQLGRPVAVGFLSAASPRLAAAIANEREAYPGARVMVASYLLAPGYFADLAKAAGGDVTTEPLLTAEEPPHAHLVDVVVDLFAAGSAQVTGMFPTPNVAHRDA